MKLEKLRSEADAKKKDQKSKITIDFAGRRVYNEAKEGDERLWVSIVRSEARTFVPRWSYDEARAVHENDQYELQSERRNEQELPTWDDDDDLINHNLPDHVSAPQVRRSSPSFDHDFSSISVGRTKTHRSVVAIRAVSNDDRRDGSRPSSNPRSRVDANDGRWDVSLHAPTVGIVARARNQNVRFSPQKMAALRTSLYRHEGRSWYTSHRGRLWIHAAAKEPEPETVSELETFYRSRADAMNEEQWDFLLNIPPRCFSAASMWSIVSIEKRIWNSIRTANPTVITFLSVKIRKNFSSKCPCEDSIKSVRFISSSVHAFWSFLLDKMEPHAHQQQRRFFYGECKSRLKKPIVHQCHND